MQLALQKTVTTAAAPSASVRAVAALFGLGVDPSKTIDIVPPIQLTLERGQIIFITGPSGSGKSTLLALIRGALNKRHDTRLIDFNRLPALRGQPIVDGLQVVDPTLDLPQTLKLLSIVGLSDAFVLLRNPEQLSEGQRYRFRLAITLAMARQASADKLTVVLADEFAATLDRITAKVLARNIRKWVSRSTRSDAPVNLCFVAATTHDDLLEALRPDTLVEQHLGGSIEIVTRKDRA